MKAFTAAALFAAFASAIRVADDDDVAVDYDKWIADKVADLEPVDNGTCTYVEESGFEGDNFYYAIQNIDCSSLIAAYMLPEDTITGELGSVGVEVALCTLYYLPGFQICAVALNKGEHSGFVGPDKDAKSMKTLELPNEPMTLS